MHDEPIKNAEQLGHEPIEVSANFIAKVFAVLFGVVVVILLLMAALASTLSHVDGGAATVDARENLAKPPANVPALEANQRGSLRELREQERAVLTEYAWIDPNAGVARVPIKRAMEILAHRAKPNTEANSNVPAAK
jgi:hypothetical protein